jgi:hypothetical protein
VNPEIVLRALRQLIERIDEIHARPDRDWSEVAIEALEGIDALDRWLTGGGPPPTAWHTAT